MALELYANPFSSDRQKVLIALYEIATPFTYRMLRPDDPDNVAAFARLWPMKNRREGLGAAGEAFTRADCAAARSLFYANWICPIANDLTLARAYRQRLLARPSVAHAVD